MVALHMQSCNSIKYKVEVQEKKRSDYVGQFTFYDDLKKETNITINFRMKDDDDVVPMFRYQPLTFVEFLAQSGGLLGLFAGISALSIIEIFYFFTLRLFCNALRRCFPNRKKT
jgi:hypothetical protein